MTPAKLHLILDAVLLCLVVALGLALQRERSSTTSLKLEQTTLESRLAESVSALTQTDTQADTTHTTTTTLKPDGTKVVEVKVEAKHATRSEVEHKQTDISTQTQVETKLAETRVTSTPMPDALSRYSLELLWNPMALSYTPSALTLGARLGNLPLWAEAGWLPQTHAYLLGLRIEL